MEFLIFSLVLDSAWVRVEERWHSVAYRQQEFLPMFQDGLQLPPALPKMETGSAPRTSGPPTLQLWVGGGFPFPNPVLQGLVEMPPPPWHPRGAHPVPAVLSREQRRAGRMLLARPELFPFAFPRGQHSFLSHPAAARAGRALVQQEQLLGRTRTLGQSLASVKTVFVVCLRCRKPGVVKAG